MARGLLWAPTEFGFYSRLELLMKKMLTLLLGLMFVSTVLVGCPAADDDDSAADDDDSAM